MVVPPKNLPMAEVNKLVLIEFTPAQMFELVDHCEEYPLFLTTGRVVSQFLSGTQTRRIGPLVKQYPEPRLELHPRLAEKLGIADGEWATCETRRGAITVPNCGS